MADDRAVPASAGLVLLAAGTMVVALVGSWLWSWLRERPLERRTRDRLAVRTHATTLPRPVGIAVEDK